LALVDAGTIDGYALINIANGWQHSTRRLYASGMRARHLKEFVVSTDAFGEFCGAVDSYMQIYGTRTHLGKGEGE